MNTKKLTERQIEAVNHQGGPCRVLAGPGSGKTTVLTHRLARLVEEEDVDLDRILAITFTSKAGAEMLSRTEGVLGRSIPRRSNWIGTMHSSFRSILDEEWGYRTQIIKERAAHAMIREIGERCGLLYLRELKSKDVLMLIESWRIRMLSPKAAHELVLRDLEDRELGHVAEFPIKPGPGQTPHGEFEKGAMGMRQATHAYHHYQRLKQSQGLIDFTDMIYEAWRLLSANPRVRKKWMGRWDFILIDEFQDIDPCQFAIVKMLAADHQELFAVGDDDQCVPPGTLVTVEGGKQVEVMDLTNGDRVMAYSMRDSALIGRLQGFPIRIANRPYRGRMHGILLETGKEYHATTNHRCIARWGSRSKRERWYCVYLMQRRVGNRREDWRVGWCQLRRADGSLHLNVRLNLDRGDNMWVLCTTTDPAEASLKESEVATRYRVSTVTFSHPNNATHYTQGNLNRFWEDLGSNELIEKSALERDFNISLDHPLLNRRSTNTRGRVVFEIHPTNVLPGLMEMATDAGGKAPSWVEVLSVNPWDFDGDVYSLDVAKHHTFIADGVVTHNSIYGFRGSNPDLFVKFDKEFRDTKTILLDRNFRCPEQVVRFASRMISKNENRLDKEFSGRDAEASISFSSPPSSEAEAYEVTEQIVDLRADGVPYSQMAIIYRTNAASLPFETSLMAWEIPYVVRNGGCFYDMKEIKPLIEYLMIAIGRGDTKSIEAVAHKPNRYISNAAVATWRRSSGTLAGLSEVDMREEPFASKPFQAKALRHLKGDLILMKAAGMDEDVTTSEILDLIMRQTDYEEWSKKDRGMADAVDADLKGLFAQLRKAAKHEPDPSKFLELVERTREFARQKEPGDDAVLLSTFHGVKGLEFEAVFLTGMCEMTMPHKKAVTSGNVGEERRLAHVGWTRSKRFIHASSPASEGVPSRFIFEWQGVERDEKETQPSTNGGIDSGRRSEKTRMILPRPSGLTSPGPS